jgi:hypothetical protein
MVLLAATGQADTHYVVKDNAGAFSPFTNWTTAAASIQAAINDPACVAGDTVLVSNGVYDTGETITPGGAVSNRVVINKAIIVQAFSTNWNDTVIKGKWDSPTTTNGPSAVRCVYMISGATLAGFTITNGATMASGDALLDYPGGGVCGSDPPTALVSNCLVIGNNAGQYGGGLFRVTARNCTIKGNRADYGGGIAGRNSVYAQAYDSTITENVGLKGGGAIFTTINRCTISYNSCPGDAGYGGGVYGGNLVGAVNSCSNSIIVGNSTREGGGGGYRMWFFNCLVVSNAVTVVGVGGGLWGFQQADSMAVNCTIVSNRVHGYNSGNGGGGLYQMSATNCIILGNWDSYYGAGSTNNYMNSALSYCCTTATNNAATGTAQGLSGTGNTTGDPRFKDPAQGNFHLLKGSACIDAGTTVPAVTSDLDGVSRPLDGDGNGTKVYDIGCYEDIPPPMGSVVILR